VYFHKEKCCGPLEVIPFLTPSEIKLLPSSTVQSTNAYKTFKLQETRLSTIEQHSRNKVYHGNQLIPQTKATDSTACNTINPHMRRTRTVSLTKPLTRHHVKLNVSHIDGGSDPSICSNAMQSQFNDGKQSWNSSRKRIRQDIPKIAATSWISVLSDSLNRTITISLTSTKLCKAYSTILQSLQIVNETKDSAIQRCRQSSNSSTKRIRKNLAQISARISAKSWIKWTMANNLFPIQ